MSTKPKLKVKLFTALIAGVFLAQESGAAVPFNAGGLGCGSIISMRESTQKPIASELADAYGGPNTGGGNLVFQILNQVPGVGFLAAATADMVTDAVVSSVSASLHKADMQKQKAASTYKNVQAVEFRFDDGEVINMPMLVVSGMQYSVGKRLNAMQSPTYGNVNLGIGVLFDATPSVGDPDYQAVCRIEDPQARKALLESVKNAVDESRIVNVSERRDAAAAAQ